MANENDRPLLQYELETLVKGFFDPARFLDFLRYFVLFERDGDVLVKKIAGYHQFHAVREAVHATVIAAASPGKAAVEVTEERATYGKEVKPGSRKAGVVWHTQGSGKSITMACYAGKLLQQAAMKNPTLVVVTDRTDLDGQLFATFSAASELLKQTPEQAEQPRRPARPAPFPPERRHPVHDRAEVRPASATRTPTPPCPTGKTSWSSPTRRTAASTG